MLSLKDDHISLGELKKEKNVKKNVKRISRTYFIPKFEVDLKALLIYFFFFFFFSNLITVMQN